MIGEAELRRLSYLVRDASAVTFDAAWEATIGVLRQVEGSLTTPASTGRESR
jgi:hypothetical protein